MASPPDAALLVELNADMYRIYRDTWKRLGSGGERFRQMIEPPKPGRSGKNYRGALETAKYLMATESKLSGLPWLKENNSLDLSVERVVLDPKYSSLFADEEKSVARRRLAAVEK
jgi:hypothetical protein